MQFSVSICLLIKPCKYQKWSQDGKTLSIHRWIINVYSLPPHRQRSRTYVYCWIFQNQVCMEFWDFTCTLVDNLQVELNNGYWCFVCGCQRSPWLRINSDTCMAFSEMRCPSGNFASVHDFLPINLLKWVWISVGAFLRSFNFNVQSLVFSNLTSIFSLLEHNEG